MIKIDKGIPMPKWIKLGLPRPRTKKVKKEFYAWGKIEVGETFVINGVNESIIKTVVMSKNRKIRKQYSFSETFVKGKVYSWLIKREK